MFIINAISTKQFVKKIIMPIEKCKICYGPRKLPKVI